MTTVEGTQEESCEEISSPSSSRIFENKSLENDLNFSSDPVDWDKQNEKLNDFFSFSWSKQGGRLLIICQQARTGNLWVLANARGAAIRCHRKTGFSGLTCLPCTILTKVGTYSISVNSTPDVSHTDQLAFVIHYVNNDGIPKERFIKFIQNVDDKAEKLFSAVMDTLKEYQIDIMDCRGQSYDNASNMSGTYSGLQAQIKQVNPLAVYIPCSANSLNLVGTTRSDACLSLRRSWKEIIEALDAIEDDVSQTPTTQNEAAGLSKNLQKLETCVDIDIGTVVRLYGGLTTLVQDTRDAFERFERDARKLSGLEDYDSSTARPRKKKLPFDVSPQGHIQLSPRDKFRVNTFLPILDKLSHELRRRAEAYKSLNSHFGLFENMSMLSNEDLLAQAHHLCSQYPNVLDDKLPNECLHLCSHLKFIGALDITISQLMKTIVEDSLEVIYPNVYVALRIFLCTLVTNWSAKRYFSCSKRVKNYLRSSLSEERLNSFALLAIEAEIVRKFSYDNIIDNFAKIKVLSKRLC
ncbi:hypothetical protein XELAEV_18031697mg [Xenopus laevis]|uniref:DUF4371 domain-containing protein n=1 Tax=Xenopus laevis TaxID=8355 RepID=A0A974CN89_XENLA|nr:hypothetical protein XELAEV_18031697mg [Xenopus laevis]